MIEKLINTKQNGISNQLLLSQANSLVLEKLGSEKFPPANWLADIQVATTSRGAPDGGRLRKT